MKYLLLIGDGMGDWPQESLGGRTPLEAAATPHLDAMAQGGLLGLARTVPEGMAPGSDVAIMSLMGYCPRGVLTGRGPLEAASLKIDTAPGELVFRLNLVTLEHRAGQHFMRDHSAGNIASDEAAELIRALAENLPLREGQRLFPGTGYRHILTWPGLTLAEAPSIPPHDHRDEEVSPLLNQRDAAKIMALVRASWPILENHPVNQRRAARGQGKANSIWLWGPGFKPQVKPYAQRWGLTGAAVSAVDLIKGLGVVTGLEPLAVAGANGWLDTNYEGKVAAALGALKTRDFSVVHLEAPDECSHQGRLDLKLKAIEAFDAQIAGPIVAGLRDRGEPFRVLAACDHYTPVAKKTHSAEMVPFLIYGSQPGDFKASGLGYCEANAARTGLVVDPASSLSHILFGPEK